MLISYAIFILCSLLQVHRACAEREILDMLDHPFLPALYASFQVFFFLSPTHQLVPFFMLFFLLYILFNKNVTYELGAPGDN